MDNLSIIQLMLDEEYHIIQAIQNVQKDIAELIDHVAKQLLLGGRLFYVGAGTSGRLGVLDASECPPTFSVPTDMVQGIIAGGDIALRKAVEGAEDKEEDGAEVIKLHQMRESDVVIGIASSGTTPFVHGALREAKKYKSSTALITCSSLPQKEQVPYVDYLIRAIVGAEILSGSTRLKAGTATKLILNMISTISMIRLGKVYDNLMVDLCASNEKLKDRALRIFMEIENKSQEQAHTFLQKAHWELKPAIVMSRNKVSYEQAKQLLVQSQGLLSVALENTVCSSEEKLCQKGVDNG